MGIYRRLALRGRAGRLMGQLQFNDGRVVCYWGVARGLQLLVQICLLPQRFLVVMA